MSLLRLLRKSSGNPLAEIERERRRIEQREREFKRRMRDEPQRLAREQAELASTLPPPDDFKDRQREYRFHAALTRGQLRNERRSQTASLMLFVLLVTATVALSLWMLRIARI